MDTLEIIHSRKSVRHFNGTAVSQEDLETILKAGMAAPTAVDKRPWAFVVVTQNQTLIELAKGLPYALMLNQAGAAIIICALPAEANRGQSEYAVIDSSLAGENILLAAEALRLGAVWTAADPNPEREAYVRQVLGIPENIIVLCVIPIGHPTGQDKAKEKYKKDKVHWEKW
jgi:nitroreductase